MTMGTESKGAYPSPGQPGAMQRHPRRRRELIVEYVLANGAASPAELAERFGVSLMTIHRDLAGLEHEGVVRKYRGGVTAQPSAVFESNVAYRLRAMQAEKDAIAARARRFLEPGMAVMLDDATTTLALARQMTDIEPLTVVTNYLETINLLSRFPGIHLIALGGDYDPMHNSFLGVSCIEAIESMRTDVVFVSTSAVEGAYAYHQEQHVVAVKRAMLACAQRKILLLDHTKLGRVALHQLCPLSAFDMVIVDDRASAEALRQLDEHKITYEVATT